MQFWQPFRKFFTGKLKFFSINVLKCLEKIIFCCNKNTSADPTGHLKRSSGNIADFFSTKGQQIFAQFRKLEKKAKLFQIDMFLKSILATTLPKTFRQSKTIAEMIEKTFSEEEKISWKQPYGNLECYFGNSTANFCRKAELFCFWSISLKKMHKEVRLKRKKT